MSVLERMRSDLRDFTLYTAGDGDDSLIRLHANESPFRASDDITARGQHRYPLGRHLRLNERLAQLYDVRPDNVLATRGSDDGIDLLIRTFCRAGLDTVLTTTPGFGMYRALARLQGCITVQVPLLASENFVLDMDRLIEAVTPETKVLFLCSPNNPSGTALTQRDIAHACRTLSKQALVVVDEAYSEYAAAPSATALLGDFDNLVVLRTLSKAYGLAAARVGAIIGHPDLIRVLDRLLTPFPLPTASVDDALRQTAPERRTALLKLWQDTIHERERMREALRAQPSIEKVWQSDANFLLTQADKPVALVDWCRTQGLLVRLINGVIEPGFDGQFVRISIGTADQNDQLLATLRAFPCRANTT